ncbi:MULTISPECIES: hypothetical protein [unclassified Sutcliffiella]|uniref:hypothetical protein n=1 Tax=unclassified Sutcliffiella TaxID=2837532 RepID=UPI0030CD7C8C
MYKLMIPLFLLVIVGCSNQPSLDEKIISLVEENHEITDYTIVYSSEEHLTGIVAYTTSTKNQPDHSMQISYFEKDKNEWEFKKNVNCESKMNANLNISPSIYCGKLEPVYSHLTINGDEVRYFEHKNFEFWFHISEEKLEKIKAFYPNGTYEKWNY